MLKQSRRHYHRNRADDTITLEQSRRHYHILTEQKTISHTLVTELTTLSNTVGTELKTLSLWNRADDATTLDRADDTIPLELS